ncbi:MAG: phosphoribosylformylglycinamidine synthase I [Nitrospinae bacterium CG11_big_fil_rev_8_21_14_0_20_56_8]|nr:MAG: phosphoribosylformylglycinamidine synthase I [Nitrospinae bacterium CG11_big_fil_rev_8_21_14_0_20_56_8]
MKSAVVVFPGSNCDHDCYHILKHVFGVETEFIWHKEERDLSAFNFVVLPGGFSYGDYLRAGAIARFSPIMKAVTRYAGDGGRVLGICNGFQILVEAGLLPGALLHNDTQKFICRHVYVKVENAATAFTRTCSPGAVLKIPIAHHQGGYYADRETLSRLEANRQVVFTYCDESGRGGEAANPNGSMNNIAGIVNEAGNVLGMMPHPERVADPLWPDVDGQRVFQSLIESCASPAL